MLTSLTRRIVAHPRRTLLLALLFVVVAGVLGGPVAGALKSSGGFQPTGADSQRALDRLTAAAGREPTPRVLLLLSTPRGPAAARTRIRQLQDQLGRIPGIASTASPAGGAGAAALTARDHRSALVAGTLSARSDDGEVYDAVKDRFDGQHDVTVGGTLVAGQQISGHVGTDLGLAEVIAFPVLLVLSLLFFRGRATLLPVAVGMTTVLGTFLGLRAVNSVYGLSIFALNLVIGLGLGLAIDYTLFLVTRFREELAPDPEAVGPAIARTMRGAGRTVLFSAATVAVALASLVIFPLNFAKSMGLAGAVVAIMAAAAATVLTPAIFALWGRRLLVPPRRVRAEQEGGWYRLSHAVMRRPGTLAALSAVVMLAAASPALRAHFTPVDAAVIPKGDSSRRVADRMAAEYPGVQGKPVTLAITAARGDGAGVTREVAGLRRLPGVTSLSTPRPVGSTMWEAALTVAGDPAGPRAQRVVDAVRAAPGAYPVLVGGAAAEFDDQQAAIRQHLAPALGVLALLTFLVLWVMTGSVILPLKAILMNVLTVGAALGALVLVYQDGRFQGLLSYTANGGIETTDFLVTAALIFALSTDYGVFLLGRIKEARDSGVGEREAVALGLQRTGAVVTAAALLLAVAIGAFATSSISFIQQIGVASAVGVLLDAFVVRSVLVPSLMGLLGTWNWWSPSWMRRVHDRIGDPHGPAPQLDSHALQTALNRPA